MNKDPNHNSTDSADGNLIPEVRIEVGGRVPKLIGNGLAHVFTIYASGLKANLEFEQVGRNG
jgi:hypothetical protein